MKTPLAKLFLLFAVALLGAAPPVMSPTQVFPGADLRRQIAQLITQARTERSATRSLAQHGSHELLLAAREQDGSAEVHARFSDIIVVQSGTATLVSGGTVIAPATTAPGEIRGAGIRGGTQQRVNAGDVIDIPPNTPHQFLVPKGGEFVYFVVKVRE